jgi:outer membrane receptor protein involved in Fe transport
MEYALERFENGLALGEHGTLNTHRLPLGVNFFHPFGLSAFLTATHYYVKGKFMRLATADVQSDRGEFWTVDAAINYRLPNRYGFITIGATNLLDKKFKYFETDINNPRIQPDRMAFFKLTLALP